jgi:hypothetical protein
MFNIFHKVSNDQLREGIFFNILLAIPLKNCKNKACGLSYKKTNMGSHSQSD